MRAEIRHPSCSSGGLAHDALFDHSSSELWVYDRRDVTAEWLTIPNSPEHWEAHALYKPEKVVDALDGILVKTTGVGFVSIVNGGSDENRRATVDAWRVYLYHVQSESQSGAQKDK